MSWGTRMLPSDVVDVPGKQPNAADPALLIEYIKTLNSTIESQTKLIFDATKYNYTTFGTVFLLSNSILLVSKSSIRDVLIICCIISCSISIACALFVRNRGIYANFARKKRSVAERTLYRGHDFAYFEKKWAEEYSDVEKLGQIGLIAFMASSQPMKSINLLPFIFSLLIAANGFFTYAGGMHVAISR